MNGVAGLYIVRAQTIVKAWWAWLTRQWTVKLKKKKTICDKNGRFIIIKISLDEQYIVLVNVYAPNDATQQLGFFAMLDQLLQELSQDNIIMGGDFNCPLSAKDKIGGKPVTENKSHKDYWNALPYSKSSRHLAQLKFWSLPLHLGK